MRRRSTEARADRDDRLMALGAAAAEFKAFRPAPRVFTRVEAVPTIFAQFDHAVRVGGYPTERFTLVHGPSGHNKTTYVLGLARSFLRLNHYVDFIDAERTTPVDYARTLLTPALFEHPGFFAYRPESYEKTIAHVRKWLNTIADVRARGKIPSTTRALVIVDSIRKLVPENILKKILASTAKDEKKGKGKKGGGGGGADGMGGRGAQIKAAMNSAWMDELTPLLEEAKATVVAIARETEDPDAGFWQKATGNAYKVGGGAAIYYDSSLVTRVERVGWVTDGRSYNEETKERAQVYGERVRLTIRKTKVAGKDDKQVQCYFHTSNGVFVPEGFDTARDVLELAEQFGIVKGDKLLTFGKVKLGQGRNRAVKRLSEDAGLLRELDAEVRRGFANHEPVEYDGETGEVA